MKLGKVVGTIVSTRKDEKIEGLRLYLVQDLGLASGSGASGGSGLRERDAFVVAADAMGAGVGEIVLYASGSSARQTKATDGRPIDAVIMAIVDTVFVGEGIASGKLVYDKFTSESTGG